MPVNSISEVTGLQNALDAKVGGFTLTGNAGKAIRVNAGATAFELATISGGSPALTDITSVPTGTLLYRKTSGTGNAETQTLATLKTDLGLTGTNSGDQTTITGNAGTATALQTARNINGVAFDGTANITINAVDSTARVAETRTISTTAPLTGGGDLSANRTFAISAATTSAAGSMSAADKIKVDNDLAPVKYDAAGSALGPTIADYFTSSISLEASSIYEIECHAYFLKTTAGTVTWTWTFSSAPTMATSRYQSTPVTGFTTSTITGAEIFAEATAEAVAAMAHAVSGSLTTAVRHSFVFMVRVRTNAATTIQLRATSSAGTITPQAGSYMRARKVA